MLREKTTKERYGTSKTKFTTTALHQTNHALSTKPTRLAVGVAWIHEFNLQILQTKLWDWIGLIAIDFKNPEQMAQQGIEPRTYYNISQCSWPVSHDRAVRCMQWLRKQGCQTKFGSSYLHYKLWTIWEWPLSCLYEIRKYAFNVMTWKIQNKV